VAFLLALNRWRLGGENFTRIAHFKHEKTGSRDSRNVLSTMKVVDLRFAQNNMGVAFGPTFA
jgi:hypothetical protein